MAMRSEAKRMDSPIPTTYFQINEFTINGFIAQIQKLDCGGARFKLVHRDLFKSEDIVLKCCIFPEMRGQSISIPWDILRKGSEVIVKGVMRPNNFLDRSGKEYRNIDFIAFHVVANNGRARFDYE